MVCPKCGGRLNAMYTRHSPMPDNETYRQRNCLDCGHQFYTVEFEIEWNEKAQKIWRGINAAEQRERRSK